MLGTILSFVGGYRWFAIGAAALLALSTIFVQRAEIGHFKVTLAAERADRAREQARAATASLAASEKYRAREEQWTASQQEIANEGQRFAARARRDNVVADASSARLSGRFDAVAAVCRPAAADPAAAAGSAPAQDPGALLADVQRRIDAAAGQLASIAEERGIAGTACERSYDALTADKPIESERGDDAP